MKDARGSRSVHPVRNDDVFLTAAVVRKLAVLRSFPSAKDGLASINDFNFWNLVKIFIWFLVLIRFVLAQKFLWLDAGRYIWRSA